MKPQVAPTTDMRPPARDVLKSREGQIQLAKNIGPVLCAIFEKIAGAFDTHSRLDLPNGKALVYDMRNEQGVSYRCGAQMKVFFPYDFLESIDEGTIANIDQMIRIWSFSFNGREIPPQLWCDNPHFDEKRPVAEVPRKVHEALETPSRSGTRGERLVNKLLPPRIPKDVSDATTERGVQKLRQTELVKSPLLIIKKRENP